MSRIATARGDISGTPTVAPTHGRGSVRQRLVAGFVAGASWLACRLPERPLHELAELAGELWYRIDPGRAAQARRNFGRVAGWLTEQGLADPRTRAAARDPKALERLVRAGFRQYARYYLDVARAPALDPAYLAERLTVETPEAFAAAFAEPGPRIFIGLHYGAIELQAYVAAVHADRPLTTPMETIDDPALQAWFERTRGSLGIRIVGLRQARRELMAALGRGEPVGIVGDRDLTGGGIPTALFGAPASIPLGPALVAIESGAPTYLVSVRRVPGSRYIGRLDPLSVPAGGSRRERVTAVVAAEARLFERQIARAPEQWFGAFFPIWPDLETESGR
jgi:phosphatidylinositol dimannoside acyltransferase